MYKIIACDLDETLLNSKRKVSKKNIEAVKKARSMGVKFVPATGRGYNSVEKTLKVLGLSGETGEYVISFNGGAVTENRENRLLYIKPMPFDIARELYRRGLGYDVCIHVYTKELVYVYNFLDEERAYVLGRNMPIKEIFSDNIDFLCGQDIVKVLYENTEAAYLNRIEKNLQDLTAFIDITYSSNRYIEFNLKGVNKGEGLKALTELLGVDIKDTIAIGDNFNDLPMIEAAGLGIGVKNAVPDMIPLCDYITDTTNDESAIAEVIEKFVL